MNKWLRKNKLSNETLLVAIQNLEEGKSSTDLGSGLYKVRVATQNAGKSGGYRSIIVYKENDRAIVIYAFSKSDRGNISSSELKIFKAVANDLLSRPDEELEISLLKKELFNLGTKNE